MNDFIEAFLEGCGAGGLAGITAVKYYDGIKDSYPKWVSIPTSCLVAAGTSILGWKSMKVIDHYIEHNVL